MKARTEIELITGTQVRTAQPSSEILAFFTLSPDRVGQVDVLDGHGRVAAMWIRAGAIGAVRELP